MHLSWILLLTSVCVACGETFLPRQWQFSELITCTQPKVNPSIYNDYGCYCGFSASGSPKDQIDQCCAFHEKCYEKIRKLPKFSGFLRRPFFKKYDFSCSDKTIICSASNDKFRAAVCECDRRAAKCIADYQHTYNNNYRNLLKDECKK
ncbi:phospholipase A2-like [Clarias gariepinus]|uniref:phospholipase A2-like n=1 Tax=Clarias gariepinus TaxID=13013 RepID=UPI00234E046C|nr:phospholipase A2-like [Clarias gariepinus]